MPYRPLKNLSTIRLLKDSTQRTLLNLRLKGAGLLEK